MPKSLIVVESPTKVKTISKFLGRDFTVRASMGHVRDLPEKDLSVDIENGFKPKYVTIKGKQKVVKQIKDAAQKVDNILIATDPDREGEAICWHLAHELKSAKKPINRITFNEITQSAVQNAIRHPGEIDQDLVDSQQARRVMDRLVGYQISPILGRTIKWGLSAGRVQSVAVRLICEREAEIEAFVAEEYWSITAKLKGENTDPFEAKLLQIDKKKAKVENEDQAKGIVEEAGGEQFTVEKVDRKERKRRPVPPFITSKLQQEASRKLRFTARKTMSVAQQLYEGVEMGTEGGVGLITYMRTDSTRVAKEALDSVRGYIGEKYGSDYLPAKPINYKSKKGAQDAHEAVRPTYVEKTPENIRQYLSKDQYALYGLIWRRFVASQMKPAILDVTTVDISAGRYTFRVSGSIIKFRGFMSVYMEGKDDSEADEDKETILPELTEGQILQLLGITPEQHFTQPPPRYSEATLVKVLEENGIGRPSTYVSIISTIQGRDYVRKERGRFVATEVGRLVNNVLLKSFPTILDVEFTAKMETELDDVEDGKRKWGQVLEEFYGPFSESLKKAPEKIRAAKKDMEEVTDEVCELCGKNMVIKWGKFGKFLSCPGYPECKNTKELDQNGEVAEEPEDTEEVCEKCGSPMAIKTGRYGKFLACTAYPECKNTKQIGKENVPDEPTDEVCEKCGSPMVIKTGRYGRFLACEKYPECKTSKPLSIGIDCPQPDCDGYLTEKQGRRGAFYGCSNYPECKFVLWNKPITKKCPECGAPFLVEKSSKAKGEYLACADKECGYSEAGK
ncbi:type I DNA topoisomerase [Candidatus Poribacteria bacterium]